MTPHGFTTASQPVLGGVAALSCTHGVPLEVTLAFFKERQLVVDWPDYVTGCLADGHRPGTIRSRILAAVGDLYGSAYLEGFTPRLDSVLNSKRAG